MLTRSPDLSDVFLLEPTVHADGRGTFHEWWKGSEFVEELGFPFMMAQANLSTSSAGVVRGLHFAAAPPGQAKVVICPAGRIVDVVVDIRRGSETFGNHIAVELSADNRRGVYIPAGFAHGFVALEDSVVTYLVSEEYDPDVEFSINPFDQALGIDWGIDPAAAIVSDKDRAAPALADLPEGIVPDLSECRDFENALRDGWAVAFAETGDDVES